MTQEQLDAFIKMVADKLLSKEIVVDGSSIEVRTTHSSTSVHIKVNKKTSLTISVWEQK